MVSPLFSRDLARLRLETQVPVLAQFQGQRYRRAGDRRSRYLARCKPVGETARRRRGDRGGPAFYELLAAGDVEGCAIWKRILAAVTELARTAPAEGSVLICGRTQG